MRRIITLELDTFNDSVMVEYLLEKSGYWTQINRDDINNRNVRFSVDNIDVEDEDEE